MVIAILTYFAIASWLACFLRNVSLASCFYFDDISQNNPELVKEKEWKTKTNNLPSESFQWIGFLVIRPEQRDNIWNFVAGTITKTCLYNLIPLDPFLYSKTGVYRDQSYSFLFLLWNGDCVWSLEPPQDDSSECPQFVFSAEIRKIKYFFIFKFSFFDSKIKNVIV